MIRLNRAPHLRQALRKRATQLKEARDVNGLQILAALATRGPCGFARRDLYPRGSHCAVARHLGWFFAPLPRLAGLFRQTPVVIHHLPAVWTLRYVEPHHIALCKMKPVQCVKPQRLRSGVIALYSLKRLAARPTSPQVLFNSLPVAHCTHRKLVAEQFVCRRVCE